MNTTKSARQKWWRQLFRFIFKAVKVLIIILLILAAAALIILGVPRLITELYSQSRIFSQADVQPHKAAVVFGAGLQRDGTPSTVLRDRVATAAELYFAGKVEKILMSGDNRFDYYNEPGSMKIYALELGVPETDIILDYAGRRTYDTCYRAKAIFGLQEAILVTQQFHLPRAIFTCNKLGLTAIGVVADKQEYHPTAHDFWQLREIPATLVSMWELFISKPLPVLGEYEPIFPDQP